jgi:hypothetical protein
MDLSLLEREMPITTNVVFALDRPTVRITMVD